MTTHVSSGPPVEAITRDGYSREIRFEFCERTTLTGGVYDLPPADQEALLLPGHLPGWGNFLPDFLIVLALGEPTPDDGIRWTDLRVHVGGLQWSATHPGHPGRSGGRESLAACDWHNLDALLNGTYRTPAAPAWVLQLIRSRTPWGRLLDERSAA